MRKIIFTMLLLTAASAIARYAFAETIFYQGDYLDGTNLSCERNTGVSDSRVYENFTTSAWWQVTGIFGNFDCGNNNSVNRAYYEIRQGITPGNGGTLIASGEVSATCVTIAQSSVWSWESIYRVTGTPVGLTLAPGSYWFTLAPIGGGPYAHQWFVWGSTRQNSVGATDGLAYWDSVWWNRHWVKTSDYIYFDGGWSFGVSGTLVPEHSSILVLLCGIGGLGGVSRHTRRLREFVPKRRNPKTPNGRRNGGPAGIK
ncbi:MAG: hypothetical protein M1133_15725 [Armatimonadetes bacterium]|nr:hypothetical protein [Armatimonadota bacterium]